MLRTHRAGKGPVGCWGWGLGSRNRRVPSLPPTPGLRGQGTSPGRPAGFLGSGGWGKRSPLLSCSSSLGGPLPPASPDFPGLPPMPPGTHVAWRCVWRAGDQPGSSAGPLAQVDQAIALCSSPALPGESLLPASPDLPSFRGADPVWPPLLLPTQSCYILLVHFRVPPVSLGVRVSHQRLAGALVVGRR